jgi:homoserine kinase
MTGTAGSALGAGAVRVRVPATSANLGSGFDTFGLALDLYDELVVQAGDPAHGDAVEVTVEGEGEATVPTDASNLVVRAVHRALDELGAPHPPLLLRSTNRIPHGRGLGSSAAAVVSGLVAGRALVDGGERLDDAALLGVATELEGHPDNAAACLLGGFTVAWTDSAGAYAASMPTREDLVVTAAVPPEPLATETARGLLPPTVPHADAAHAAARSALLVLALQPAADLPDGLLLAATEDRLHQGYRAAAMPVTLELVGRLRADGRAAVVSGAGPSILVLDVLDVPNQLAPAPVSAPEGWRVLQLAVARGVTVRQL